MVDLAEVVLEATNTDWSLFNQHPENRKCAQVVLYEKLKKPRGAALVTLPFGKAQMWISTLDYSITGEKAFQFWSDLGKTMGIDMGATNDKKEPGDGEKKHDLLLDGPAEK